MSIDFQTAITNDMAVITEQGQPQFVDNQEDIIEATPIEQPEVTNPAPPQDDPFMDFDE